MTQPLQAAPTQDAAEDPAQDPVESWRDRLDRHAEEHGFHVRLSPSHGALFTEEETDLLVVSFETAETIRASESQLPFALSVAGREGWSQLCLYSEGETWFRDAELYAFFDDLVDDGFFDNFGQTVFYGAGHAGYAAAAYSVAAPGSRVLAIRPQATLDPAVAGWDSRFRSARRADFTSRYGYGPEMIEAAGDATIIYDPTEPLDAMHAALFDRSNVTLLRAPHFGPATEAELEAMHILAPLLRAAGKGRLDAAFFAEQFRRRRRYGPYLRRILERLELMDRPWLTALWCRAVLRDSSRTRFERSLARAEAQLAALGRSLPPEPETGGDETATG